MSKIPVLLWAMLWRIGVAYLVILIAAFGFQRHLMYHPDSTPFDPQAVGLPMLQKVELIDSDGEALRHWYAPPADKSKPAIVFFHGNTGQLATRAHKYGPWIQKGYGVLLIGYRGFGNPGQPSEEALYADARQALFHVLDRVDRPEKLVLYGESLGTGIATQMALEFPVAGLVLEAPYSSYPDAGASHYPYLPVQLMALDRYETLSKIGQIKAPLLVLHGRADQTVPFTQGETVFNAAPEPKTAFFIPEAGHNNLYDFGAAEAVEAFLDRL